MKLAACSLWRVCTQAALAFTLALVLIEPCSAQTEDPTEHIESAIVTEGRVPVLQFLQFVQYATGKPVLYPSTQETSPFRDDVMIDILGDVAPLTIPVVKSILEMNGYELLERQLEDGSSVIQVTHQNAGKTRTAHPDPGVIVPPEEELPEEASTDRLMTLVLKLRYADTGTVVSALRELLGVRGGAGGNATIVNIASSSTLLIKGKKSLIQHVREIVVHIDRALPPLPQILEVVEVHHADAQDLAGLVTDVLSLTKAAPGNNRTRQPAGRSSNASPKLETYTRLVPDPRTQAIIIDSTDATEVDLVLSLIERLDQKVEIHRANTHVYRVKYLKAADLAEDLRALVEGSSTGGGLSASSRRRARARGNESSGQQQRVPTRIVPHDETNSLLIQAEEDEYQEIETLLAGIDRMRRQVFLEVALVQVLESSSLNYTFEFLAGTLDDSDTRLAAMSAFGLSSVDPTGLVSNNFTRVINPGIPQTGLLAAVSRNGQLPMLLRALKADTDSMVIATPFILAVDNEASTLNVQKDIYYPTAEIRDTFSVEGQDSEQAGITLTLTPTISEEVVLLEMTLDVSAFAGTSSGGGTLPDRSSNAITSYVTIPDGEIVVIGGLSRETESLSTSKVPILGDLPVVGRLFQSRATDKRRDNLYIFVTAHVIEGNTQTMERITEQAQRSMSEFRDDFPVQVFDPAELEGSEDP